MRTTGQSNQCSFINCHLHHKALTVVVIVINNLHSQLTCASPTVTTFFLPEQGNQLINKSMDINGYMRVYTVK